VIQRAREAAEKYGVSADFSEQLMVMLIRSSLTVQERDQVAAQGSGSGKRVLIIGGNGNMGRWFARFMSSQGYQVEVADPSGELPGVPCVADWRDADLTADIIVVAAPMAISNDILTELSRLDGLKLISRTSVMRYRDTEASIRDIGQELGVAMVLEGSVQRSGERGGTDGVGDIVG